MGKKCVKDTFFAPMTAPEQWAEEIDGIRFEDLFHLEDIQRLQDEFSMATGVASIITRPDGTPITHPSNFTRLCNDIIRKTEKGLTNCFKSDAVLGRFHPDGPVIQPCLSGGLWDAGTAIMVGGRHIANWLIGQVRNEAQCEDKMRIYARKIGAEENEVIQAFREVPAMSREQFANVAQALFTLANQLSSIAYKKLQQARFIAERRQVEDALQEREAFLNEIILQNPIATWIADAGGTLLQANPALKRILNLTDEQLVGKYNIFEDPLLRRQGLIPLLQSVYEEGKTVHFTCDWNGKDVPTLALEGSNAVSIEATMFPIHGPNGKVTHAVINWIDVTEKKQTRKALRESKQRFKAILEASPDPVVVYDDKGRPNFLNPAFTEIFGWSLDELRGQPIPFVPEDQKRLTRSTIEELYRSGKPVRMQTQRLTKQGAIIDVIVSAAIIKGPGETPTGMVVNLTDVSEQKKLQLQLQHAQKMEAIGRLAGGVAHDFNNMLSIISGNAEMALDDLDEDGPIVSNILEIQKAAERSTDLTRQLLAFARKQIISPKRIDLNKTIEGLLKMLGRLIGEDIDLAWRPAADLWPVQVDPSQIDQIMANLCINARESIHGVGKVIIETGNVRLDGDDWQGRQGPQSGDFVLVAISDDGIGMDQETLSTLFEPFFTTKGVGEGSGLGLATVYGIIKQNNGLINVYSEPEHGTTFKIYLPRAESVTSRSGEKEKKSAPCGNKTILLVEDEASILRMTTMMLQRLGYSVIPASTPKEAIHLAKTGEEKIHLLMTDVVMPEMSGRDLAKALSSINPALNCLYMSGYTANVIAHHGILEEGVQFINKPFTKKNLAAALQKVFDAAQEPGRR